MAAAVSVAGQDTCDLGADGFGRTEEGGRVEVALQGDLVADAAACFADVARPVQAQCVCADLGPCFPATARRLWQTR